MGQPDMLRCEIIFIKSWTKSRHVIVQVPFEARLTASGLNCGQAASLGKCQFTWGSQQVEHDPSKSNNNLGSQCTRDSVAAVVCEPESRSACGQVGLKIHGFSLSLMPENPGCNCLLGIVL